MVETARSPPDWWCARSGSSFSVARNPTKISIPQSEILWSSYVRTYILNKQNLKNKNIKTKKRILTESFCIQNLILSANRKWSCKKQKKSERWLKLCQVLQSPAELTKRIKLCLMKKKLNKIKNGLGKRVVGGRSQKKNISKIMSNGILVNKGDTNMPDWGKQT